MNEQFLAKSDVRSRADVDYLNVEHRTPHRRHRNVEQRTPHRRHRTGTISSFQADWSESEAFVKTFRLISTIVAFATLATIVVTLVTVTSQTPG